MLPQSAGRLVRRHPYVSIPERYPDDGQHGMTIFEPFRGDSSNECLGRTWPAMFTQCRRVRAEYVSQGEFAVRVDAA